MSLSSDTLKHIETRWFDDIIYCSTDTLPPYSPFNNRNQHQNAVPNYWQVHAWTFLPWNIMLHLHFHLCLLQPQFSTRQMLLFEPRSTSNAPPPTLKFNMEPENDAFQKTESPFLFGMWRTTNTQPPDSKASCWAKAVESSTDSSSQKQSSMELGGQTTCNGCEGGISLTSLSIKTLTMGLNHVKSICHPHFIYDIYVSFPGL